MDHLGVLENEELDVKRAAERPNSSTSSSRAQPRAAAPHEHNLLARLDEECYRALRELVGAFWSTAPTPCSHPFLTSKLTGDAATEEDETKLIRPETPATDPVAHASTLRDSDPADSKDQVIDSTSYEPVARPSNPRKRDAEELTRALARIRTFIKQPMGARLATVAGRTCSRGHLPCGEYPPWGAPTGGSTCGRDYLPVGSTHHWEDSKLSSTSLMFLFHSQANLGRSAGAVDTSSPARYWEHGSPCYDGHYGRCDVRSRSATCVSLRTSSWWRDRLTPGAAPSPYSAPAWLPTATAGRGQDMDRSTPIGHLV
ncbi:hypothetical protein BDK51DRAFT_42171 [Blyttiomyces helicus]|uniref:Uncharacterized protein n=1 Tax=Blyttiomyces helicus TaxID=388810 RepID=A0A4P9W9E0_9FUNG|nr:hypothetical protein BDK51DRAFT_42171 [Blyttiomyces helicus]|eukprot:RKO87410.1 hypothetical protein BDK51DRAFT_42171 [Blyttiomyces helicus]